MNGGTRTVSYLLMRLLEVLHEHGDDDVDKNELSHEHKDYEEEWREVWRNATVLKAVVSRLALFAQRVLHDAVPVVARGDSEKSQEGHSEGAKVCVLAQALARVLFVAFWKKISDEMLIG